MTEAAVKPKRPDYGIDAPGAVRNLAIGGCALLVVAVLSHFLGWGMTRMASRLGIGWLLIAGWMVWDSKFGQVRERERLLDLLTWTGRERVLEVGCGRGLLLVGAAKRLTPGEGSAAGIDLWQKEDLSGNRPEATLENARLEGVAERVEVRTADMRQMPFPGASFDTVLSMNAIHNIYSKPGRAGAIAEICRVLKPGGAVLIVDIRHIRQYAAALGAGGCSDVRRASSDFGTIVLTIITLGAVRPGTLIARKDAQPAPTRG